MVVDASIRYWAMYQSKSSDAWRPWYVLSAVEGDWTPIVTYADEPAFRPLPIESPVDELLYAVENAPSVFVVSLKLQVFPVAPPYRHAEGVVNVLSVHCWM
jgi:hypothetical protein